MFAGEFVMLQSRGWGARGWMQAQQNQTRLTRKTPSPSSGSKGRVKWFDPAKGYGFVVPDARRRGGGHQARRAAPHLRHAEIRPGQCARGRADRLPRGARATAATRSTKCWSCQPTRTDAAPEDGGPTGSGAGEVVQPHQGLWLRAAARRSRRHLHPHGRRAEGRDRGPPAGAGPAGLGRQGLRRAAIS